MASCCYGRQNGNANKTPSFEFSTKARLQAMFGPKHCNQGHHDTMTGCTANGVDQNGVAS